MNKRAIHIAKISGVLLLLLVAIGFVEKKNDSRTCTNVIIQVEDQYNNFFIDENDVMNMITNNGVQQVIGASFDDLNLREIEQRVIAESFVKDAQLYRDLTGNLIAKVHQRRPLARVITNKANYYIGTEGANLPISDKYTSRVVLLSGNNKALNEGTLLESEEGKAVFELIHYINDDPFWKAQIAQVNIDTKGDLTLMPQVTKQLVEFGKAEDIEKKFTKLKIFYKEILPRKGWNLYSRVNLKYKDQIIAE